MSLPQVVLLAPEAVDILWCFVAAARRGFVVDQLRKGSPDHAEPLLQRAQAEIDIVIGDGEFLFVERADLFPARP